MYVRGLTMGFTTGDLDGMSVTELMCYVSAWAWLRTPQQDGGRRAATQDDIDAMLA